jgi:uncharacterized protein YjbJ (UPF0337 family)
MGDDLDKTKGRVKEAAGDLSGDRELKREGKADRTAGEIKDKAGKAVDRVKEALRRDKTHR